MCSWKRWAPCLPGLQGGLARLSSAPYRHGPPRASPPSPAESAAGTARGGGRGGGCLQTPGQSWAPLQSLGLLLTADVPMVGGPQKPQAGVASGCIQRCRCRERSAPDLGPLTCHSGCSLAASSADRCGASCEQTGVGAAQRGREAASCRSTHRRGRENSVAGLTDLQEPRQFLFRKCYFAVVETRTAWTLQRAGLPAVQAGVTGGGGHVGQNTGRRGSVLVQLGLWSGRRAREQMHGAGQGGSGYRTRCRGRGSTPPALPRWGGTHDSSGGPTRHCITGWLEPLQRVRLTQG